MSLEDKFYPKSNNPLTQFDNLMVKTAGLIGELYQQTTGNSYKELEKTCSKITYYGNLTAAVIGIINPFAVQWIFKVKNRNFIYESLVEEEIKFETQGMSKLFGKAIRSAALGIECSFGYLGAISLNEEKIIHKLMAASFVLQSVATMPYLFANYMSKAHIPKPPAKTVFSRIVESLRDPQLIPVRNS